MAETSLREQEAPGLSRGDAVRAVVRLDLLLLRWRYLAVLLVMYASAVALAVLGERVGELVFLRLLPMVVAMVATAVAYVSSWNADLVYRMRRLYGALPLRPEDLLRARYTLLLVYLGLADLLTVAAVTAVYGVTAGGWGTGLVLCVMNVVVFATAPPVFARFDSAERAMTTWVVVASVSTGLAGLPLGFAAGSERLWPPIGQSLSAALPGLTALVVVVSAAGLYASWRLSLRLHRRRDL